MERALRDSAAGGRSGRRRARGSVGRGGGGLGREAGVEAELIAAGGLRPRSFSDSEPGVVGEDFEPEVSGSPQAVGFSRNGMRGLVDGVGPEPLHGGEELSEGRRASLHCALEGDAVGVVAGIREDPPGLLGFLLVGWSAGRSQASRRGRSHCRSWRWFHERRRVGEGELETEQSGLIGVGFDVIEGREKVS